MSEPRHFNPIENPVEYKLDQLILMAMGEASVAVWDPRPTGNVNVKEALRINNKLRDDIMDLIRKA